MGKFRTPRFRYVLTAHSTAELSAGLTCTCLPMIPALFSQRRTSRGNRALEKDSRSRHPQTRKQPTDLGDKDPFNKDWIELSEGYLQNPGALEGGEPHGIQISGLEDLEAKRDDFTERPAITKTVVIEQSHNVQN